MMDKKPGSSIGHLLVLTGLWFINLLIVLFGFPFLIYKKIKDFCFDKSNKKEQPPTHKPKPTTYFQRQIDSKL